MAKDQPGCWARKNQTSKTVYIIAISVSLLVLGGIGGLVGAIIVGNQNLLAAYKAFGVSMVSVSTLAGNGSAGYADGVGPAAKFAFPFAICADSNGSIYVADTYNHRIRLVSSNGTVSTFAGTGVAGNADGVIATATFSSPGGIAIGPDGTIYVSDTQGYTIRKISSGVVSTLAGSYNNAGSVDGQGSTARFNFPSGIAVSSSGDLYLAEAGAHKIRKITPTGLVSTISGNGSAGFLDGPTGVAQFNTPSAIALAEDGSIYVADSLNNRIRKIGSNAMVTTIAGNGTATFADGLPGNSSLRKPNGVALDLKGNLVVCDGDNNLLRYITISTTGSVYTLAGNLIGGFGDGQGTHARFKIPYSITIDRKGVMYVYDFLNARIRKIAVTYL